MVTKSYSEARARFAELYDRAVNDRETVIITRRNRPDVALIAADDLSSLLETVYLMRSPANAARLTAALARAKARTDAPSSIEALRAEVDLDDDAPTGP